MGNSSSEQELSQALQGEYQVESLSYLLHKRTKQSCTLHKITTNTEPEANLVKKVIEEYGKTRCQSISQLRDHFNVDNTGYCSNEQHFYLVFQGKNNVTLKDEYLARRTQQTPFKQHEVQHIVETYLCGLREYSERFKRSFDKLTLDSIGVDQKTRKIVLTDAYLSNGSTTNHFDTYAQFIASYPSPEKLNVAYNSKTGNYDEFPSNLFSVGVISLQIMSLNFVENIYLKKKEINYEEVRNRVRSIRDDKLRQGVECLLNANPTERKKIYQLWGIENEEQHFLQPLVSPLSTEREMVQTHNKAAEKTYPGTTETPSMRRLAQQQNRPVPIMQTQQNWHHQPQPPIVQRTNSHMGRRFSPPPSNFNNQKPIQNIPLQQPLKNRAASVNNPSNIKISFADTLPRTGVTPRQSTNIPPLAPYVGLTNIVNEGTRKEALTVTRGEEAPYNPYSYYTNSANSSLNEVNRSQHLQFRQENPSKVISPPRQKQQISPRRDPLIRPIEKETSPINYAFSSTTADKQHHSPVPQKNPKPIQKNSQTPTRPTNKYKHNSTIVEVQDEDSVDRTFKSDDKAELQYVAEEYQTGSRYEGYKSNGMRNGLGKFYYQDGGYYEGRWRHNRMEGYGKLYYNGGKLAYQGNWVEDQFSGAGKVYNDNPTRLAGAFDYTNFDLLEDYWEYYEGHLSKDTKQGRGKIKLSNGEIFEGDFHNDRIQGLGKFYNYEGKVIEGIWKESKLLKIINSG